MIRPAEFHVFTGVLAVTEGRECALLSELVGLERVRARVRGRDARLDQALLGIRRAALLYRESSYTGTVSAPQPEPVPQSALQQKTVGTTAAAEFLGISSRAVTRAITDKRLAATKDDGGRYRITQDELTRFAAER